MFSCSGLALGNVSELWACSHFFSGYGILMCVHVLEKQIVPVDQVVANNCVR